MNHTFTATIRLLSIVPLFILLLALSNTSYANPQTLIIKDAWIAEAPPVSKVMVAYLNIFNASEQDITITKAESEHYSSIEFHETKHEDGLARMIRHKNLLIPAKASITLKQGGKHLMLFNPNKRLKAGDAVKIKLTSSDHNSQVISVTVKKTQF